MKKMLVTTSWDDGHRLDMKLATLLADHGLAATFYVAPEHREFAQHDRLTKEQVRSLSDRFEIGAHTMTHPRLSAVDASIAADEIARSKSTLEDCTGKAITSFCYPGGDYTAEHQKMVKDAGFTLARTVRRFSLDAGTDPFALPTTSHAYRHWSDASAIFKEVTFRDFPLYYLHWDDLAIHMFEKMLAVGTGVFHVWGHSWEIEKNGDWKRLERLFRHMSGHSDIDYVNNRQILI